MDELLLESTEHPDFDFSVENAEHPGDIGTNASATVIWYIKNIGHGAFGDDCKLKYVSGDGLLVSEYDIPNAKQNETVKISLSFNAFSTPGKYETKFRLSDDGMFFGPALILKVNVIDSDKILQKESNQKMTEIGYNENYDGHKESEQTENGSETGKPKEKKKKLDASIESKEIVDTLKQEKVQ